MISPVRAQTVSVSYPNHTTKRATFSAAGGCLCLPAEEPAGKRAQYLFSVMSRSYFKSKKWDPGQLARASPLAAEIIDPFEAQQL